MVEPIRNPEVKYTQLFIMYDTGNKSIIILIIFLIILIILIMFIRYDWIIGNNCRIS